MWISCGKRASWQGGRKSYRNIFNLEFLSNNLYLCLVWVLDLSKLKIFRLICFCIARTKLRALFAKWLLFHWDTFPAPLFLLHLILNHVYICMCLCVVCVCESRCQWKPEGTTRSLGTRITVSCPRWVLETKFLSPARTVGTLTSGASLQPPAVFPSIQEKFSWKSKQNPHHKTLKIGAFVTGTKNLRSVCSLCWNTSVVFTA